MKHGFNPWYSHGLYCSLSFFRVRSVFPQVMPILKLLYNPDSHNAHHIYMSLIILLILSQDENFNKSVHELVWTQKNATFTLLIYRTIHGNPRQSWILDSTPWIPDSRYWIPNSLSVELGFRIQSLVGFRISWDVFRIPTSKIPGSTNNNFPGSGIQIPPGEIYQKNYFCCPTKL